VSHAIGARRRQGASAINDPTKVSVTVTIAEKDAIQERNVAGVTRALRSCAQRAYHMGTFAPGSADLAIVVKPNGDVDRITSTGTLPSDERDCMERHTHSAVFDPAGAARTVHVHVVHDPLQR
jgi:hypothetical protein